jgi:nitroreductase
MCSPPAAFLLPPSPCGWPDRGSAGRLCGCGADSRMGFGARPAPPAGLRVPPSATERPHAVEFLDVIAGRRSVRHFNSKLSVSDDDVRALLEAAVSAPTAGNIQPWRFVVVRSLEARERLASALHQKWATGAPVTIVVCVDPRPCYARYNDRGERLYALQDTAAAVENILLAAVDRGLAACWVGAFDEDAVREALGVASPITPIAIIPVGHSAEAAGRPARRPLSEVTTWL